MLNGLKSWYWKKAKCVSLWRQSLLGNEDFRAVVWCDHLGSAKRRQPIPGEIPERSAAAVDWLLAAHDASADGGVSYGYFPPFGGWEASYPETTGYIMTSLLRYAQTADRPDLVPRVLRMGQWEAQVQMPDGAVQGGKVTTPDKQNAAAFNTGMVLDGFVSLLLLQHDEEIASAASAAAGFLVSDLSDEGFFKSNGAFVSAEHIKLYHVLCAWAMYRYGLLVNDTSILGTAVRVVEAALTRQRQNGWFADNCLSDNARPLTHTIGYTLQGILEVGALSEREDFVTAVTRGFEPIVANTGANGFLAGRFDQQWQAAVRWSCLTGAAQLACVGYRLSSLLGATRFAEAADRLVDLLKATQRTESQNSGINGAIAGSLPILGDYMSGGYPNWATKYYLDALMHQAEHQGVVLVVCPRGELGC